MKQPVTQQMIRFLILFLVGGILLSAPAFAQNLQVTEEIAKTTERLNENPADSKVRIRLVNLYYQQGMEDLRNNLLEDASKAFQIAVNVGLDRTHSLPENMGSISEAKYALAYAHASRSNHTSAISVLGDLVEKNPGMENARYLLGVSLIRTMDKANISRGLEVLRLLALESQENQPIVMTASSRLSYNVATVSYADGNSVEASTYLTNLSTHFGYAPGSSKTENQHLQFARGLYLQHTGDLDGAGFELDSLALSKADYALENGVSLNQVRANLYYDQALQRIRNQDGKGALDALAAREKLGTTETDADKTGSLHLKALAFKIDGNDEALRETLQTLKNSDSDYFQRVLK